MAVIAEIFSCSYSAQMVSPSPKLTHERRILGMLTSPQNDSHCLKMCCCSGTPSKVPIFGYLGPVKPLRRNSEIFQWFTHVHTDSRPYFKNAHNRCWISGRKCSVILVTKKTIHVLPSLGGTPGAKFPNFMCECAPSPLTYIPGFIQIRSHLGRQPKNPSTTPEQMQYRLKSTMFVLFLCSF